MRRLLTFFALTAVLVLTVAGCGGGSSGSPLEDSLGYLPKDAPFVAVIDTDTSGSQYKALAGLVRKFPFGRQVEDRLKQEIESGDVSFDKDVKPLLGNPFVVGAPDAKAFSQDDSEAIGAIRAKDGKKLEDLVKREKAKEQGEKNGAKLYKDSDGDTFAIKDDTLIVGGDRKMLEAALARHDGDDKLDEDTFNDALGGLPESSLVRVYSDLQNLIASDPDTADARKVKWVSGLRTLGLTMSAKDSGLDVDFNLATEGVSESDLPLASGDQAPPVIKQAGELSFGMRDPSQLIKFAESAGQSVNPSEFGDYQTAKRQIEQRLGVSLDDDVIGQLTEDVAANVSVDGKWAVRAELKDPAAFTRTLRKVADVLPKIAEGSVGGTIGLAKPKGREGFYALAQPDGDSVVFGVLDDRLVISNDPQRAGRLAVADSAPVSGAKGSLVMTGDAAQLVTAALRQSGAGALFGGSLFTGPLEDLTGNVSTSPEGMKGKLALGVK